MITSHTRHTNRNDAHAGGAPAPTSEPQSFCCAHLHPSLRRHRDTRPAPPPVPELSNTCRVKFSAISASIIFFCGLRFRCTHQAPDSFSVFFVVSSDPLCRCASRRKTQLHFFALFDFPLFPRFPLFCFFSNIFFEDCIFIFSQFWCPIFAV